MKNTQIHVVKSLIYTIVVAILVSILVFKVSNRFAVQASYTAELARTTVNLAVLNHLRLGEINQAVEVLEQDLQANALVLDVGPKGLTTNLHNNMQAKLREIKLYLASSKPNRK